MIEAALVALDYLLVRTGLLSHLTERLLARTEPEAPPYVIELRARPASPGPATTFTQGMIHRFDGDLVLIDGGSQDGTPVLAFVIDGVGDNFASVSWVPASWETPVAVSGPRNLLAVVVWRFVTSPTPHLRAARVNEAGVVSGTSVFVVD
ncbi:hypothetical protein OJ998_09980 [Solirubrobacter taibaiensis]|nr:hypothetical protein [Solirubrobacter taibaiensis]